MSNSQLTHLGIILDGNRRWAKAHNLPTFEGHRRGSEVFKEISLAAFRKGVRYLSAFVFSTENWQRTEEEVGYLMSLVMKATEQYLDEFHKAGIRIVILGEREGLPKNVLAAIERTTSKTAGNTKGTLALCFNYGGQREIVEATKKIMAAGLRPEAINEQGFVKYLYEPEMPPLDLVIRTSGEQRLSGFMLYRAAYAEFSFVDKHWPDFTEADLDQVLTQYASRQRRFGR